MSESLTTLDALVDRAASWAGKTGAFGAVGTEEPMTPPVGSNIVTGLWHQSMQPARSSGLAAVSFRVTLMMRALIRANVTGRDKIMRRATDAFMLALLGDLSLDGACRTVDVFGSEGQQLSATTGYVMAADVPLRSTTITIPVIVNDLYVEAFQ